MAHHFFWPFHLPDFPPASSGTHVTTKTDLYRIKVCFCIVLTFCHKISGIPYAGHFSEAAFSGMIRAWLNASASNPSLEGPIIDTIYFQIHNPEAVK